MYKQSLWFPFLAILVFIGCGESISEPGSSANAGKTQQQTQEDLAVVPDEEKAIAAAKNLTGPDVTKGLSAVNTLVAFQLAKEFKGMEGQQLRARELTFEPGAVVAIHQHDSRPGFAYILEGEMVEHRSDQKEPLVRRVGDVAVEWTGISHWWENQSGKQVRALVVDILDPDH